MSDKGPNADAPLWTPSADDIARSNMRGFMDHVAAKYRVPMKDYADLHRWSIEAREDFWNEIWDTCGIIGVKGARVLAHDTMPGAIFFPDASLNFAVNLLRRIDDTP